MNTVNHYGVYVDSDIPTTGVLSINSIEWDYYPFESEICLTCEEMYKNLESDHDCEYGEDCSCSDFIECDSSHDKILGDWILDTKTGLYEIDYFGDFSAIVRESTIQIVYSKTLASGALCSPCYAGQVDLDSKGGFKTYTLPEYLIRSDL